MNPSAESAARWRTPKIQAHCVHGTYRIEQVVPNWASGWPWVRRDVLFESNNFVAFAAEVESFALTLDELGQAEETFGLVGGQNA